MDQYLGEIRMFSGDYAPRGWALCDGRILSIADNDALFSLIGTTYGGDGRQTFALPDMRGRALVHQGTDPQSGITYTMGEKAGTEQVTLTAPQMSAHTHAPRCSASPGEADSPENAYWAQTPIPLYSDDTPNAQMDPAAVFPAGGGQAHDNMMPFLTVNFIIALQGVYPTRE